MSLMLKLAFLFFIGSLIGWVMELFFRYFFPLGKPERKWVNPGFCMGPYLPLYGFGLCVLYLLASMESKALVESSVGNKCILFLIMAVCMTLLEYIAGVLMLKVVKVRLWDYREEWGNIQGIICPRFSVIWACLGAIYYFFIHPHILDALDWLSHNLAFSFVIGFFYGVFILDVVHSTSLIAKLKKYAEENEVIIRYEALKAEVQKWQERTKSRYHFFRPFRSEKPLHEYLLELKEEFERKKPSFKKKNPEKNA